MSQQRTPTETLVKCLEDFGDDEPIEVVVCYTTSGGDVAWSSSTDSATSRVGLLETVKHLILRGLSREDQ